MNERFITKFTFNFYNHKREQTTNKIKKIVTRSDKIAKLVKVGKNLVFLESTWTLIFLGKE